MIKVCRICKKEFKTSHKKRIYCSKKCYGKNKKGKPTWNKGKKMPSGKNAAHWKGGITRHTRGYILIHKPNHPFCDGRNYVRRSRLVMEKYLGRYLTPEEVVHHKKEIDNDRIGNLKLFSNNGKHLKLTLK